MTKYFDVNAAGHSIRCKLYCNDMRNIRHMVLCGHGFGGHKDNRAAQRFAETVLSKYKTAAVLTFNWPCHGDDVKKKLTLSDCDAYITLILQHIQDRFQTEDVCGYATSFGGYLFLKYISDHGNPFRRLVLRCPAVNMYEALTGRIISPDEAEKIARGRDVPVGYDRKILVNQLFLNELREADIRTCSFLDYAEDILILHGTKDEVIPLETVCTFADDNLIEFVPVDKADHRFQDYAIMGAAIRQIIEFLELK